MKSIGHSKILGTGGYIPNQIVTSSELMEEIESEKRFGIPANWLENTLGIHERRHATPGTLPSSIAIIAAERAIQSANIDPVAIDLVLFCAVTRDEEEPATAYKIQNALAPNADCWDVSNACNGFMSGLTTADAMIGAGAAEHILIVTGEISSKGCMEVVNKLRHSTNLSDFKRWVGFLSVGDAAGAMILGPKKIPEVGMIFHQSITDGRHHRLCYYDDIHSTAGTPDCQMQMRQISTQILLSHKENIPSTYKQLGWKPSDVDTIISHQVSQMPINLSKKIVGVPKSKVTQTVQKLGNLTSASVPVNWWMFPPKPNDKVLILGSGSGFSIFQGGIVA